MLDTTETTRPVPQLRSAKDWVKILAAYRDPKPGRSAFELAVTLVPFLGLWALAWAALAVSPVLSVLLSVPISGFLLRLFIIQHDCGHGAFFSSRALGDWLGRVLGVVTLTPYDVWRRSHSIHHSGAGNLGRRGLGDIHTLTVAEYRALSPMARLMYRVYRSPLVLFCLGPGYIFFVQNRVPYGLMDGRRYWISAMLTNAALLTLLAAIWWVGGWAPILYIFVPSTLLAATVGVWLFYVQHQFETTHWEQEHDWQLHEAALEGSSHYVLPKALQWLSGNIGIHHVHHLYSRIPFYRLTEVLRDHKVLEDSNRMTVAESFANARLHLWDEESRRLLSFRQARALLG
ncbi:fatty acid desaturase [Tropicibacter sp. S64]|uniref:fatty acid desaturase n=1 Tax=Tropicibacter sp. S64 TaxID=3415122 RepID=UPI003C7BF8F2